MAKYISIDTIKATIDGVDLFIPASEGNYHYQQLLASGEEVVPWSVSSLEQLRSSTSLFRADFCNALADAGIITDAEAIDAARGGWPESFAGFLDYLDAAQGRAAQISWASCATIQRNHEFVLLLAWWKSMTDEEVDALFNITQPES